TTPSMYPYTTLCRSRRAPLPDPLRRDERDVRPAHRRRDVEQDEARAPDHPAQRAPAHELAQPEVQLVRHRAVLEARQRLAHDPRSEEHTSELQSREN